MPPADTAASTAAVAIAHQQGSPNFDAARDDSAGRGDVLWDPGPLVPIDDPPPYEPLVGEEAPC